MVQFRRIALLLVVFALLVASTMTSSAQSFDDALVRDAKQYASMYAVDLNEAIRRLQLQDSAGGLESILTEKKPESFAGLWIQHSPDFRIIVQLTSGGIETIRPYVEN